MLKYYSSEQPFVQYMCQLRRDALVEDSLCVQGDLSSGLSMTSGARWRENIEF